MDPNDMSAWNFQQPGGAGYPPSGGFPGATSGYPSGYPAAAAGGYPGVAPAGYPGGAPAGYPGAAPAGYPGGAPAGYPGAAPAGYPGAAPAGYPGAAPAGYPGAAPAGYPGAAPAGYPGHAAGVYPGAASGGYPGATPGGYSGGIQMSAAPANVYSPAPASGNQEILSPTVKPQANFDASADCQKLRKAMKGIGTDEQAIIDVLAHRSADQRQKIRQQFKTMYGKDLIKELDSELSGHFQDCVLALCYSPEEFAARELRRAMEGAGTNERALIEILFSIDNDQLRKIIQTYQSLYKGRSLEKDLQSETSGHFKRILISQIQANRDESTTVNQEAAANDARLLFEAGEKRLGTDESTFNMILASKSFPHLRAVFAQYETMNKRSIEKAIDSETSGDLRSAYMAIVRNVLNRPRYFAHELEKSMKGAGTRDSSLIRIIVSRCEIDMGQIKQEFQKLTSKPLANWIKGDTKGDYCKILLALIGEA